MLSIEEILEPWASVFKYVSDCVEHTESINRHDATISEVLAALNVEIDKVYAQYDPKIARDRFECAVHIFLFSKNEAMSSLLLTSFFKGKELLLARAAKGRMLYRTAT